MAQSEQDDVVQTTESLKQRTTAQVLRDHLENRSKGDLDVDIDRNYHPGFVLLHLNGIERGHAGMRKSGRRLQAQLPGMEFVIVAQHVHGEYAYIEWTARSETNLVGDGADSFVIRDGKIIMQTIHYTLQRSADLE